MTLIVSDGPRLQVTLKQLVNGPVVQVTLMAV